MVACIFVIVLGAHLLSPAQQTADSRWSVYTALSVIYQRNTDLNEYQDVAAINSNYAIYEKDGHIYNGFPVGASLLAVPVLVPTLVILHITGQDLTWHTKSDFATSMHIPAGVEALIASLIIALAAVFIYLIGRLFLGKGYSLLLTFIFAFCTSAWSTGSRALWQQGPSMLMLAIALYLILRAQKNPRLIQYASLPLAFSYVVRPTNLIPIVLLSLYALIRFRSYFLKYVLWSLPVALLFLFYNLSIYSAFLSPYYHSSLTDSDVSVFFEALLGNLISPARGILIFSPIFLFSLIGMFIQAGRNKANTIDFYLIAIIFLHWIAISLFIPWWGGYSYGPRLFADMVPFLIYFLIPVFLLIQKYGSWKKWSVSLALFAAIAVSFFMNGAGALDQKNEWNSQPVSIDAHPERLWDWHDLQFMRWRQD